VRTTKRSKFVALAVGLALVAAACGDDKESSTTAAPETTAGGVTETTAGESTETTTGGTEATETTEGASTEAAMRVTYTLSDVAVWDDGSPITVDDFQCTQDAIMNTPGSLSTTGYDQIIKIATGASDKEIVVDFAEKYAPWKGLFSGLLKASATEDCMDVSEAFDGGIPYSGREWKIDSWNAEQLVLVPNEGYTGSRKPTIDRVVVVPAEDGPTALKSGAVDFIFPQAYTGIDTELADPNVDFDTALSGAFEGFYFQSYEGPFADPVYRTAFSESIDRQGIYDQIYAPFAQGTPLLDCGPIAPGPYCDNAFADGYQPDDAKKILTDAGWTMGADGFWADKDGNVPDIRWMVNTGNTRRESTQEYLIPKLAEAGFKVHADNCEALPCVFETRLPSLDYDMAMFINTVAPDPAYLRTWGCDQIPTEENDFKGQNSNGWCNEDATAQLIAADAELDETKRIDEVKKAIQFMADDHIMLPLLQFPNVGARRTDRVDNAYGELANYRAINDWYQWKDVDGDGQIIVGAEQFPDAACANPITECSNSSWYVWLISFPILPGVYDTTNDQTFVPNEILTGDAVVEDLTTG
jgi:peptide/nickel transport system substrate-binding protein